MLHLNNVSVEIAGKKILKKLSFNFEKGNIYAIMGPNGSGKSTLAYSIMGHPAYTIDPSSQITLDGDDLKSLSSDKRAEKGIFLSFQQPLSLPGVRVSELLHLALTGKRDPLEVRQEIQKYAKELKIPDELLTRSLNEGASGGEKKKLEVLQAAVLNKKVIIFDEVDTGVDIDSLRIIAEFLKKYRKDKTYIIVTHYNRILKYLKPDQVLVIRDGSLVKTGDHTLADLIEKKGYEIIT